MGVLVETTAGWVIGVLVETTVGVGGVAFEQPAPNNTRLTTIGSKKEDFI